jgi:hypothetical protein
VCRVFDVRILLTGSRLWPDGPVMPRVLRAWGEQWYGDGARRVTLVHGACPDGADAMADGLWTSWGWPTEPVPADWPNCVPECIGLPQPHRRRGRRGWYCPGAGMRRNAAMVGRGADMAVAFPVGPWRVSPGTQGCMRLVRDAGIPLWEYRPDGTTIDPFPKRGLPEAGLW